MSDNRLCVICNEGNTSKKRLIHNPAMVDELSKCCSERLSLGQTDIQELTDRLTNTDPEYIFYHSECRKPIVNKTLIERLGAKRSRSGSPSPGRPIKARESVRPKRTKSLPKAEVCVFSSCSFCRDNNSEPVHRVLSDNMGESFLEIKSKTLDDQIRTCVADLEVAGDASALEKYYHRKCLRSAQRSFIPRSQSTAHLVQTVCDEHLLYCVENALSDDDVTLNMSEVNNTYLSILRRYHIDVADTSNYRKHLKTVISDRLPNIQFVKSLRKNEPDNLVLTTAVSKAMDLRTLMLDNGEIIGMLKNMTNVLRDEMLQYRNWSFSGNLGGFDNPPLLQFFLTHLLFGNHVSKATGKRSNDVNKTVDVACQFLIQNTRTERQVRHQPKKDDGFRQTVQTPLSIGLPLAIHSRVRDKSLVNNLSAAYIGSDYQTILNVEKRVEQGVLERMKETGGFCLPDFVKRDVNTWFAVDNIDLLEDTPTGQNTFHGTVIVINQRAVDGEPMNPPLVVPERLCSLAPLALSVKYMLEPIINTTPLRFDNYQLGKRSSLISCDFTHTWALANYHGTDSNSSGNSHDQQELAEEPPDLAEGSHGESILSLTTPTRKGVKITKEEVMPTWAATKSLLLTNSPQTHTLTKSEVIAPLLKTPPPDYYTTLYTALMLAQGISATVVGPNRRTIITLDLDLYSRALKLQQSVGNTNWILRAGALHIAFALLHALGKTVDASGIDTCCIESGIYTSAALRGIYSGKAYKRGVEYHITTCLAILMMRYDAISDAHSTDTPNEMCAAFKKALHDRSPDMRTIYSDVEAWYLENVKPHESCTEDKGELGVFLMQYLQQVDCLLQFISSACRSGDWEGYLAALEENIKYFFAHDLLNYARLMPVHLAQMNALEHDDPSTWEALKSGDFVVAKSEVPFTHLFTDQTLEQEIKVLKRHGGIVGLSRSEAALDRIVTTTPHIARIVQVYLESFPQTTTSYKRHEHYHLSGNVAIRTRENALKLRRSIELHCTGNPFIEKSPLKVLVSSTLVPAIAKDDILHFAIKGKKRFEEFVNDRLLLESTLSVWDSMKKLKLKTFSNWMAKSKLKVGDKIIKLREERELLGRFLIIQNSRPELVPKLQETIGEYEMSVVPRALCAVDGSLYIPADKASMIHAVEEVKNQSLSDTTSSATSLPPSRVLVVDAMAVLQSMKKTSNIRTLADLEKAFINRIESMMIGYDEGRVVFDRYMDQSLKNKTRQKRVADAKEFEIHPAMKLTMSLKELLSSTKTKKTLTILFAEDLLKHFSGKTYIKIVVVYETKIKSFDFEQVHTHEEADTLIPNQVLASVAENACREVCVWSPDTDVLILLLDLVSCGHVEAQTGIKFLTGRGNKYREIDVVERVQAIGHIKCQGLIGLHNFSGADWGGKFVGISKKTWVTAYMKLDEKDPVINCFRDLGQGLIQNELVNGQLPLPLRGLEQFLCRVYCPKGQGPQTLPDLRWELFRSKNLEGEMLPPTRASLLPHISRSNFVSMRDKSYITNCPALPPIEQNGWNVEQGVYVPVRCLLLPAPQAVIELIKCACKTGCNGNRCACQKNNLPCTPLCKCFIGDCANLIKANNDDNDNDHDD